MRRSSNAMGWCAPCGKLLYDTRKKAKRIAREHHQAHKSEYPCPVNQILWHVGEVPEEVIKGNITRNEYYGKVS